MQIKEQKIATFTTKEGKRIQLLEIIKEDIGSDGIPTDLSINKYQIRSNRKIILTTISLGQVQKKMASMITEELLQTKFTF